MHTLVVTSIAGPSDGLRGLAAGALEHGVPFVLIGDEASPRSVRLEGCEFYGLEAQRALGFELAAVCPTRHYARKNIGYLVAMARGAEAIVETDDDTVAYPSFWEPRARSRDALLAATSPFVNVYRYFTGVPVWPRGLPLDAVQSEAPPRASLSACRRDFPIQQGLVDDDPDVDAIYRLVLGTPFRFDRGPGIALEAGSFCPFNSQNTTWFAESFPLLYLPAHCSFRMTDIWRSFVAQRVAWANGWSLLFHEATVRQERNSHDLMRDFRDEVAGYVGNRDLCERLAALDLRPGLEHVGEGLRRCYETLVEGGFLPARELPLVDAWLEGVSDAVTPLRPVATTKA